MSTPQQPSPLPPSPRLSGRVVVIAFVIFIVVGVIGSVLLAKSMRPATMEARERVMPLAGTVQITCVRADGSSTNVREKGACPKSSALTFSIPDAGRGLQQITYVVLSQSPQQAPVVGQFARDATGRVELTGMPEGPSLAGFLYTTEPIDPAIVRDALKKAPAGDIPLQERELEVVVSDLLKTKKEARLARVYFKVVP